MTRKNNIPIYRSADAIEALEKALRHGYTYQNKEGKTITVREHFVNRDPAKVQAKHTRNRRMDMDGNTAAKKNQDLHQQGRSSSIKIKKAKQTLAQLLELKRQGKGHDDNSGLTLDQKIEHTKADIANHQQHIDNHNRLRGQIKARNTSTIDKLADDKTRNSIKQALDGVRLDRSKKDSLAI